MEDIMKCKAEELIKKLKRLDEIPLHGYDVRGKPNSIQTVTINGESLVPRWHKRCKQYKINLINQFKKESLLEFLYWWMPEIHPQDAHSQINKFENHLLTKQ